MKADFNITGMTCSACSSRVQKSVENLAGINSCSVNLLKNSMSVDADESVISEEDIIRAVVAAGYGAEKKGAAKPLSSTAPKTTEQSDSLRRAKLRLIASFVFILPLFYLSMGHMMGWPLPAVFTGNENALIRILTQLILVLPIVAVNFSYYKKGSMAQYEGQYGFSKNS